MKKRRASAAEAKKRIPKRQRVADEIEATKRIGRKRAAKKTAPKERAETKKMHVSPPNFRFLKIPIVGIDGPYVQNRFGARARQKMHETQEAGGKAKSKNERPPKDFQALYRDAMHISTEGWHGIPTHAFRSAMISACKIADVVMTKAKLCITVRPDGFSKEDAIPLVRITKGKPVYSEMHVRNADGSIDLRARPLWEAGWQASVTVRYDADRFDDEDIVNLMVRSGIQVGVGEGRADSKKSSGMGWGSYIPQGVADASGL